MTYILTLLVYYGNFFLKKEKMVEYEYLTTIPNLTIPAYQNIFVAQYMAIFCKYSNILGLKW